MKIFSCGQMASMDGIRKFLGAFFLFFLRCLFLPGLEDGAALLLEDAGNQAVPHTGGELVQYAGQLPGEGSFLFCILFLGTARTTVT